jgi:hypothetical protein
VIRVDTISVEGMPEPIELRLTREPPEFDLPFTTYVPEGFLIEPKEDGDLDAIRFVAAFGGVRNPSAFLEVAAYPPEIAPDRASWVGSSIQGLTPLPQGERRADWAVEEWRAEGRDPSGPYVAWLGLGRAGERWFHVLSRYPLEYGDGFPPRAAVILEEWRWADGEPLTAPARR